jgi:hypothetical protein
MGEGRGGGELPVIGRPRGADHGGTDPGQHGGQLGVAQHAVIEAEIAGFEAHLFHHGAAPCEFVLAEAKLQPAVLLEPDGDPGALLKFGREARPRHRRCPRPALIMRRTQALALHPDQPEIAARGAVGNIAFVEEGNAQPGIDEAIANRRADQPAADHDCIEAPHRRRPAAQCQGDHKTVRPRSEGQPRRRDHPRAPGLRAARTVFVEVDRRWCLSSIAGSSCLSTRSAEDT